MALRVIIAGGSMGGLASALRLRALGHEVQVFEAIAASMRGYGAGLVVQPEIEALFTRFGLAGVDQLGVGLAGRQYLGADGSVETEQMVPQRFTSWGTLYRPMRRALDDSIYVTGRRVVAIEDQEGGVAARLDDDTVAEADLLIAADGAGSTVRNRLLPNLWADYAGYVAWRGLLPEAEVPDDLHALFGNRFTFFQGTETQILCYLIPGNDGELERGRRRLNWVWYRNVGAGAPLRELLVDRSGRAHDFSLPPCAAREDAKLELRTAAQEQLPPPFAHLIEMTTWPFIQAITDLIVPRTVHGRVVLIGDAACILRPHTAYGTAKAFADAAGLADAIEQSGGDVDAALAAFEGPQLDLARRMAAHGQRLGAASGLGLAGGST